MAVPGVVKILTETGPMAPSVFSSIKVTTPSPSDTATSMTAKLIFITGREITKNTVYHFRENSDSYNVHASRKFG